MEKKLFLAFLLLISIGGLRSQTLIFEYETGGNQIIRQYCASNGTPIFLSNQNIVNQNLDYAFFGGIK